MKHGTLYATLTKTARLRRLSLSLRTALSACAGLAVCLCVAGVADNLLNLPPPLRAGLAGLFFVSVGTLLTLLYFRDWHRPADAAKTAVFLEQRYGITDNRIINAVQFAQDPNFPKALTPVFTDAAETACSTIRLQRIWKFARLQPALGLFAAAIGVLLVYATVFGAQAQNALHRFTHPATSLAPLNHTQFVLTPGDQELLEGSSCLIRATATRAGHPVSGLDLVVKDRNTSFLYPMRPSGDGFVFDIRDLADDLRYAVRNGRDSSLWHTLSVIRHPALKQLAIRVTPPGYTGDKPWLLSPEKRQADILTGSRIQICPGLSPNQAPIFHNGATEHRGAELAFSLSTGTTVSLDVKDARGFLHPGLWQCQFHSVADTPPAVRFLNRELNVQVDLGQSIPLHIEATDDFGLTALEIFMPKSDKELILKKLTFRDLKRSRTEICVIPISEACFAKNTQYTLWARVYDNRPSAQCARVPAPISIHVADPSKERLTGDQTDPYVKLFTTLSSALEEQKSLRDWLSIRIERDRQEQIGRVLQHRQRTVHEQILLAAELAADLCRQNKIRKALADRIAALRPDHSAPLMAQIPIIIGLDDQPRKEGLNTVVLKQSGLISALQRILGILSNDKVSADQAREQLAEEQQDQKLFEKLLALKKDLAAFQTEQRKTVNALEGLDKKNPEDWTEAEEKLLGDLAAKQQDLAKFFQAAFNDLSKLENQDFSNSGMAAELIEMIEELQKSGGALEKKHIEIATVNEELLGEQASGIEANLERWLADAKDYIKWNGEEGGVNPDVPLQDLPDELTDIIGDLIDNADDMQDVEDSTGSSLSAFDKGIGWGTSDGNMDDMSAKGITGNSLPNNNEVGGRSGEGRSGKSGGQFVEQEATGKGGRNTPTRLVQSPFEKGTVQDSSKDPQGGATGGGKQSGLGDEGLRGVTPDQKTDVQQRLPGQQAELKQKAEALLRELNVRNLPTGDLEDAITKMELIQKYRATGQGLQAKLVQSDLLASLKSAKTVIDVGTAGGNEKRPASSRRPPLIRHHTSEETPTGYEESVDAYFRALAEPAQGMNGGE